MSTPESSKQSMEHKLQQIEEQLTKGSIPDVEQFRQTYNALRNLNRRFQELLQWATEQQRGKKDEEKFQRLYQQAAKWNASHLMNELRNWGFYLRNNKLALKEAFDNQGYRILQLVRTGKRDEVFHALLRIFIANKEEFPKTLSEPFKPVYSDQLFKVFLFTFLSSILGKEDEKEGKEEDKNINKNENES